MQIGIDASTVLNFGTKVGSGRYIINLIKSLLRIDSKRYLENYFAEKKGPHGLSLSLSKIKDISFVITGRYTTEENLYVIKDLKNEFEDKKIKFSLIKTTQEKLEKQDKRNFPPLELFGFKSDILHCPDYLIAPSLNKNIVLTIHDLSFYRYPEFNFEWFIEKYKKIVSANSKRAKKIIADSCSTKNDIINFMDIEPSKISVVHLAAEEKFKKLSVSETNRDVLKEYGIKGKYLLGVGTIEPRKNFKTLIKAFNKLKAKYPGNDDLSLVIAGKTGWKSEETFDEFNKSRFKDNIIFAGAVSDEDLIQLYNMAGLFVYPSVFEGFGLPLLEAMSCGAAAIAADSSSIPEIMPDKELLFNALDENEIALKIQDILKDDSIKEKYCAKSLELSKSFSWAKNAQETLDVYLSCFR